jgi:amino acid adenylation domain-containing protein
VTSTQTCIFPPSFAQQRLWFLDQLEPGNPAYNISRAIYLTGPLQVPTLEAAINQIVQRHESLRTTFATTDGNPVQVVRDECAIHLSIIDLSAWPPEERSNEEQRLAREEAHSPFDLNKGPLLRAVLVRLSEEEHVLLLTLHHIISDGWSAGIMFRELATLYEAFRAGKEPPLQTLPIQYPDYAVWQREWLQGEVLEKQLSYWRRQLADAPDALELPADRPRELVPSLHGGLESLTLSKRLTDDLKTLSQTEGVTLFMILLAALQALLSRYTGDDDILVGSPFAGRNRIETEGLIGFFINTVVLRTSLSGNPTFRELLQRVKTTALDAYAHEDLPFEKLIEELHVERNRSYTPLLQVMFAFQNASKATIRLDGGLSLRPVDVNTDTAKFDLTLLIYQDSDPLICALEYNTNLFDADRIIRMLRHFETFLDAAVADPELKIGELPLLTKAERRQLLIEWNPAGQSSVDNTLPQLFEEQVRRAPSKVALTFNNKELTYEELNRRANRLAHYLKKRGVGPEVLVGICVERSLEMVVGLLGILKAGGAYLPLDPSYPQERLAFMLEEARVSVLLTQEVLREKLPAHRAEVIALDIDWEAIAKERHDDPRNQTTPDNLVYVMYTSGSTGRPKGISVVHRNVVRLVKESNYATFGPEDVFLQFAPISFDASTFEIWGSLLNGARLVIMEPGLPSLEKLGEALKRNGVSTLWLTAGLFQQMVETELYSLRGLRQFLAGGDVLSVPSVERVSQELSGCQLVNGYGPTENTTFTCCYKVKPGEKFSGSVPIGRPISRTQVFILDERLEPVPIGINGELCISGDGLARGYLDDPAMTAEKFVPNPFTNSGNRLYRTGDRARYLAEGNIEFLGRIDQQVKVRGYRIELGEIETRLGQHEAVQDCVAVVRDVGPGEKQLVAYVVKGGRNPTTEELRSFLKAGLPDYMVPASFVFLDQIPLTPNGKVDRRALPQPESPTSQTDFVAPRTASEETLAAIWSAILKVDRVGIHDNFFDLGGHSLLATQVVSRVRDAFQIELPLRSIFETPTIAGLSCWVNAAPERGLDRTSPAIKALPRQQL